MGLNTLLDKLRRAHCHIMGFHRLVKELKNNSPSRRELRRIVRAHCEGPADYRDGKSVFGVSRTCVGGAEHYLRLYRLRKIGMAARNIWASGILSARGVNAPVTVQACIARAGKRFCLALLETGVKGEHLDGPLPASFAPDLAGMLSAFHAVSPEKWKRVDRILLHMNASTYRGQLKFGLRHDALSSRVRNAAVREALRWLDEPDFVGDFALSHGDLHHENMLRTGENEIGVIDLDTACIRPLRHDLALAESTILQDSADAAKAFEESYFQLRPAQAAGWDRHRTHWLVLHNLCWASQMLGTTRNYGLRQRQCPPEDKRRRWAEQILLRTEKYLA
jgi:aminoglycoside phosphotransferase (APT) family kinase protein